MWLEQEKTLLEAKGVLELGQCVYNIIYSNIITCTANWYMYRLPLVPISEVRKGNKSRWLANRKKYVQMLCVYAHFMLNPNQCTYHRGILYPCYIWYRKMGLTFKARINFQRRTHTDIQSAQRGTTFIPRKSESHTQKSCLLHGDFVWGIFNMVAN